MPSSTFKGLYQECNECVYQFYDNIKNKNKYNLSKLDVSRIKNMDDVFMYSLFDGDISQWNTSNVTSMDSMFNGATKFNSDISKWDVSKVITMDYMFANTKKFNRNISNWNLEKIRLCEDMFDNAKAFLDKYNNGKSLPYHTDQIIDWLKDNRERINMIDIKDKHGEEVDSFFSLIKECNDQLIYSKNLDCAKKQ